MIWVQRDTCRWQILVAVLVGLCCVIGFLYFRSGLFLFFLLLRLIHLRLLGCCGRTSAVGNGRCQLQQGILILQKEAAVGGIFVVAIVVGLLQADPGCRFR